MEKYEGINTGKICLVELIEARDIEAMYFDKERLTVKLDLLPQKAFVTIEVTEESATLKVEENNQDDGSKPHYQVFLSARIPKVQADRMAVLHGIKNTKFIARATDVQGNKFVIGSEVSPATLLLSYGIDASPSGPNEASISIASYTDTGLFQQVD